MVLLRLDGDHSLRFLSASVPKKNDDLSTLAPVLPDPHDPLLTADDRLPRRLVPQMCRRPHPVLCTPGQLAIGQLVGHFNRPTLPTKHPRNLFACSSPHIHTYPIGILVLLISCTVHPSPISLRIHMLFFGSLASSQVRRHFFPL